ncbi:hypothetical protein D3C86_1905370 [compost metagenome]
MAYKIKARLTNTTIVRSRVAKSELTFSMPTFAKMAVIAANAADNRAQNVQEEKKPEPMCLRLPDQSGPAQNPVGASLLAMTD